MKLYKKISILLAVIMILGVVRPYNVKADDDGSKDIQNTYMSGDNVKTTGDNTATTVWVIDCDNVYDGMESSYSDGYVPTVSNGEVHLVLPVMCSVPIKNNEIRASFSLGESQDIPFVYRNYEKKVALSGNTYIVNADLELRADRVNGSYPVIVTVVGESEDGQTTQENYTVYVTISDGKDPDEKETQETQAPVFQPKLVVESYKCSVEQILDGDSFDITVTLRNMSDSDAIRDLTVRTGAAAEQFELTGESDSAYISDILPGESKDVIFSYRIKKGVAQGQYDIPLTMEYANALGNTYTAEGHAKVRVDDQLNMQFDALKMPDTLTVTDVVNASIQAINLGRNRVYNVRAVIEADGLKAEGTIFIGALEPGTTGNGTVSVDVTALTGGDSQYGNARGKVICYYEDEDGNEYTVEQELSYMIMSPFSDSAQQEQPDEPSQWWWIIGILALVIILIGSAILMQYINKKRKIKNLKEECNNVIENEKYTDNEQGMR